MSAGAGNPPRVRPVISFRPDGLHERAKKPDKPQASWLPAPTTMENVLRPSGDGSTSRELSRTPEAAVCGAVPGVRECDDFSCSLMDFEREMRRLAERLTNKRHLREEEMAGVRMSHDTSVAPGQGKRPSSPVAVVTTGATTVAGPGAPHHLPLQTSPLHPSSPSRTAGRKKTGARPVRDASCVQEIALNVWATLGFFSLPPFDVDPTVKAMRSEERRGPPKDFRGSASLSTDACSEDEESIFLFVAALERHYQWLLASEKKPSGKHQEERRNQQESQLTEEMLRYGLWYVLFNAVFYCVTIPGAEHTFTSRDLECFSGGMEDRYNVVYASSSRSSGESGGEEDEDDKEASCSHVAVGLQWHTDQTMNRSNREKQKQRQCDSRHWLTPEVLRRYRCYTELDEAIEERRDLSCSRTAAIEEGAGRAASVSKSDTSRRAELVERLRRRATPFSGRLEVPPPIMSWYFVVRTLSQLGYTRDAFFLQTPLHGSLHELLLALLWITKEYHLVALAEYVQLQRMYPFLLQWEPVTCDENKGEDYCGDGAQGECTAEALKEHAMAVLLRCFPEAAPWPPASFIEKEHIAHRLEQLQRILPADLEGGETSSMRPTNLVRRLLAMRRLVALSLNRLESALHQRAEQIVSLGLHSDLDVQLCRPEFHDVYRQLCSGLQHLHGMETRVCATTEQLSLLGSLVAWALNREAASEQVQDFDAAVVRAVEDDESTWLQQGIHYGSEEHGMRGEAEEEKKGDDDEDDDGVCDRWRLRDIINNFHATGMQEYLSDLAASIRRSAQVDGGGGSSGSGDRRLGREFAAMQQRMEEQVRQNMATRYSLDAALKAELWTWQYRGVGTTRSDDDDEEEEDERGKLMLGKVEEACQRSLRGLGEEHCCVDTKTGKHNVTRGRRRRAPFVSFDLVMSSTRECRPQATAVGRPAEHATTSARLDAERLQAAKSALLQQEECVVKHTEECRMASKALEVLQRRNLRVVHRKRRQ